MKMDFDECMKRKSGLDETKSMWKELLDESLGHKSSLKILNTGAGQGYFSILLAQMGNSVTAIDTSDKMIDSAKRNFDEAGVRVKLYKEYAHNLEHAEENSYDAVVSRNSACENSDPKRVYKEWMRVLKPGGKVIICDRNYCFRKYSLKKNMSVLSTFQEVSINKPEEVVALLNRAGFINIKVSIEVFDEDKEKIEQPEYCYQSKKYIITALKVCD